MLRPSIVILLVGCASQPAGQEPVKPAAPPVFVEPAPAPSSDSSAKEQTSEEPRAEAVEQPDSAPESAGSDSEGGLEWIGPGTLASIGTGACPGCTLSRGANAKDRVVKQHLSEIRSCWKNELAKQPDLSGRLVVRFEIGVDGHVSDARAEPGFEPNVDACVLAVFKRMTFPKPRGGKVIVRYPLIFRAVE